MEQIKNQLWEMVTSYDGTLEERYKFFELINKLIITSRSELIEDYINNPQNVPLRIQKAKDDTGKGLENWHINRCRYICTCNRGTCKYCVVRKYLSEYIEFEENKK